MNGVPVVSTSTGAAKDAITHKENGYLVGYENIGNDLADGIDFMMQNNRKSIGQRGRETTSRMYEFQVMFENHKKLYLNEKNS